MALNELIASCGKYSGNDGSLECVNLDKSMKFGNGAVYLLRYHALVAEGRPGKSGRQFNTGFIFEFNVLQLTPCMDYGSVLLFHFL